MSWIIVGAGYTGERVAARLLRTGQDVTVTRRSPVNLPGCRSLVVDLADRATVEQLHAGGAVVVCCAPPGADPEGEMRTFVRAVRHARRVVYVSSTGVYAPGGGAWVDEAWPLAPTTTAGRARVVCEGVLTAAKLSSLAILRVAGIYGPGRGTAERLRAGTYRVIGDGRSHVSRIHVDDLVEIIVAAGEQPEVTGPINVADDDPAPIGDVADTLAAELGLPRPPRVDAASVSPEIAGMLLADRRIANKRLAELDITLRYPSWRDAP
ncbi:MAG: NAD(P)H-binding protein [Proteobacteria bacterium]|nr:NAD(P)H-binding protein [Pseudomonadota bacterium]